MGCIQSNDTFSAKKAVRRVPPQLEIESSVSSLSNESVISEPKMEVKPVEVKKPEVEKKPAPVVAEKKTTG